MPSDSRVEKMPRSPHVVLLIETTRAYGRGLLRGIVSYVRTRQPWIIHHKERALSDASPDWLDDLNPDGIIVRADSLALAEKIQQLNIPAVDLRGLHHLRGVPLIETNDRAVVEMAFEHLSERKFKSFAFCGFANANYSERRLTYLREITSERNLDLAIYGAGGAKQTSDTVVVETEDRIGYRAAELLTDMINGESPPNETQFVEPIRVVTRESSDVYVVADEDVADAIRQIRNYACEGITVDQLVNSLPISRTVLEKRFAKYLGTSPKSEINRIRLARIKQLLVETEDSLAKIADATGFRHPEYMSSFFRTKTGETPGGFRKRKQR